MNNINCLISILLYFLNQKSKNCKCCPRIKLKLNDSEKTRTLKKLNQQLAFPLNNTSIELGRILNCFYFLMLKMWTVSQKWFMCNQIITLTLTAPK